MIVTAITEQKKDKEKFNVFIDGEFSFSLIKTDILYFKIKENEEILPSTVEYIKETLLYIKAQDKAIKFLSYKMRTEKEIRKKLEEYDEMVIEKVVDFLKKYNYIDDFKYAQSYIRQATKSKPKGMIAIKQSLRELGVSNQLIEEALNEGEFDEVENATRLLEKKLGGSDTITFKEKKKLQDFLLRKGYSYAIIKEAFKVLEIKVAEMPWEE